MLRKNESFSCRVCSLKFLMLLPWLKLGCYVGVFLRLYYVPPATNLGVSAVRVILNCLLLCDSSHILVKSALLNIICREVVYVVRVCSDKVGAS